MEQRVHNPAGRLYHSSDATVILGSAVPRTVYSVASQLVVQSQAAALTGVQVFNNPLVRFKSETFLVLMNIAWTYLLHAHYRKSRVEYRYFERRGTRHYYDRTAQGAFRYWSLSDCLNSRECPLDPPTKKNLEFLIGLRDEIVHHISPALDQYVSARYQACLLNYNRYIKEFAGHRYGLDQHITYSLQLQRLSREQFASPTEADLPSNVRSYIAQFDSTLTTEDLNSDRFAYSMLFVPRLVGKRRQADEVIEFVKAESEIVEQINSLVFKEVERPKFLPSQIVTLMKSEGHHGFSMHWHTELWQSEDAKDPARGWGVSVAGAWYWYQGWVEFVRQHCIAHASRYA